jgi:glycosyltransferase involved in cell wall biosynthesis
MEYRYANVFALSCTYLLGKFHISSKHTGLVLNVLNPKILKDKIANADLIQIESPWQFEWIYKNNKYDVPLILCEHNVEYKLSSQLSKLSKNFLTKKLNKKCKEIEKFALEHADSIITMCNEDASNILKEFDVSKDNTFIIPNGVNVSEFFYNANEERERIKEEMGLKGKKIVLFTGSKYGPNLVAIKIIKDIARQFQDKDILFIIAGTCGSDFKSYKNLLFTGYVDNILPYFKASDIAINPMMYGSGTNLKMLEYLSSGLPTITTEIGARGLDVKDKKDVIISRIEDFPRWINDILHDNELHETLRKSGRKLVEEKYDWKKIAEKQIKVYEKLLS